MKTLLTLCLLAIPYIALADAVPTERAIEDSRIETLLNNAGSRAVAEVRGDGTTLNLRYSSPEPMHVIILFLDNSGHFHPADALVATLPIGVRSEATIYLPKSPAWHPGTLEYRLHFLTEGAEGAAFQNIEFSGQSLIDTVAAGWSQLMQPLPYTPSSYHRLIGYKVYNLPVSLILGLIGLCICGTIWRFYNLRLALFTAVFIIFMWQIRFAGDALYYSINNSKNWLSNGTYAAAGSLPLIASDLHSAKATGVYLCTTGTSYARRVLAYHAYPIPVTRNHPSHIVVHGATDWEYDNGQLRCGNNRLPAQLVHTYADTSALYTITQP